MKNIRNFVIISHIDHGKSTLADRLLELTQTIPAEKMHEQYLDSMDLERERGVTIKMAPVRMLWQLPEELKTILNFDFCILNLIDTPGHADFSYEVSRSLKAVEGALLLVDATQGVQAQTLFNLEKARAENLKIIPIINKIDLPNANIEAALNQLTDLGFQKSEILKISAKTGQNVEKVLEAVVSRIPAPKSSGENLKALIFDSLYDPYKGAVAYVRIFEGNIKKPDQIKFLSANLEGRALEVGFLSPEFQEAEKLSQGEIGYIKTNLKEISKIKIGDTVTLTCLAAVPEPFKGYLEPETVVTAGLFPTDSGDFPKLKEAIAKLKLNDNSLSISQINSPMLGAGFNIGFLGTFHLEITKERLEREFDLDLIATKPKVNFQKTNQGFFEPFVKLEIITPPEYFGKILELTKIYRLEFKNSKNLSGRLILEFSAPLSEIITGFNDDLKNVSQGFASMSYRQLGLKKSDLVELDILILGDKVEPLSEIVFRSKAEDLGRNLVKKIKNLLPRQQFQVPLQAAIGGQIIARETLPALRKNVTGHLYGGDVTRKRKLLDRQAEGKKRLKSFGRIDIPKDFFLKLMRK